MRKTDHLEPLRRSALLGCSSQIRFAGDSDILETFASAYCYPLIPTDSLPASYPSPSIIRSHDERAGGMLAPTPAPIRVRKIAVANVEEQGDVYEKIIQEVVDASKNDFEESGVGQGTLNELQQVSNDSRTCPLPLPGSPSCTQDTSSVDSETIVSIEDEAWACCCDWRFCSSQTAGS